MDGGHAQTDGGHAQMDGVAHVGHGGHADGIMAIPAGQGWQPSAWYHGLRSHDPPPTHKHLDAQASRRTSMAWCMPHGGTRPRSRGGCSRKAAAILGRAEWPGSQKRRVVPRKRKPRVYQYTRPCVAAGSRVCINFEMLYLLLEATALLPGSPPLPARPRTG
jgi:hypothetical protein